jgi:hypothetical protein
MSDSSLFYPLSVTLSSLFRPDRTWTKLKNAVARSGTKVSGWPCLSFLSGVVLQIWYGPGGCGCGMSKRRQLNGGFLFVHKRSVADVISVDRDEGRLPR